jgi:ParB-like chromosome segregation protein Spo0J
MATNDGYTRIEFEAIELLANIRTNTTKVGEIKASIESVGLRVPLEVQYKHTTGKRTTDGKEVHSRFFLIDGYTRYEAIRRIRTENRKAFADVPVLLKKCSDREAKLAMLVANVPREALGILDTGNAIKMLQNLEYSTKDIATAIGKSTSWCSQRIHLAECLDLAVLKAVDAGEVTLSAAIGWVDLEPAKQLEALAAWKAAMAVGGKKAAKKATSERDNGGSDRPQKPRRKEVKTVLEQADLVGVSEPYWRGIANGIRYMTGVSPNIATQAAKEAKRLQKDAETGQQSLDAEGGASS